MISDVGSRGARGAGGLGFRVYVWSRGARGAGGICCVRNECSGCRETKPESGFSRKQWADRAHSRKCGSVRAWRGCGWS